MLFLTRTHSYSYLPNEEIGKAYKYSVEHCSVACQSTVNDINAPTRAILTFSQKRRLARILDFSKSINQVFSPEPNTILTKMILRRKNRKDIAAAQQEEDRRVHFDDSFNELYEIEPVMNTELWYQPWERNEQKLAIKLDAQEWRKKDLGILLYDVYVDPNPRKTQSCLNAFAQLADNDYARGIERHLSQPHYQQRTERKQHFVHDVLEQAYYLSTLTHLSDDAKRERLAEFSSLQSKCAEVFARRLGRADAAAALKGENPASATKLVSKLFRQEMRRCRSLEHPTPEPMVMATVESSPSSPHRQAERRVSFPIKNRYF